MIMPSVSAQLTRRMGSDAPRNSSLAKAILPAIMVILISPKQIPNKYQIIEASKHQLTTAHLLKGAVLTDR